MREWVKTIGLTIGLFLFLITFVAQGYMVYGGCMEPNLCTGERLLGNKLIYRFSEPSRGDVVIFRYPRDPSQIYVKRIIGLPGEVVEMRRGRVFVNNHAIDEHKYLKNRSFGNLPPRRIGKSSLFVLGDNRNNSNDSRFWGNLPIDNIQAKACMLYWPFSNFKLIP